VAEENLVEIELENLVLGQRLFDSPRQEQLRELARVPLFGAQEEIARNLLGYRARALGFFTAAENHVHSGAQHALPVEAGMFVKTGVLGGDEGVLQLDRNLVDLDRDAPGFAKRGNQAVVGRVDPQWNLQA